MNVSRLQDEIENALNEFMADMCSNAMNNLRGMPLDDTEEETVYSISEVGVQQIVEGFFWDYFHIQLSAEQMTECLGYMLCGNTVDFDDEGEFTYSPDDCHEVVQYYSYEIRMDRFYESNGAVYVVFQETLKVRDVE